MSATRGAAAPEDAVASDAVAAGAVADDEAARLYLVLGRLVRALRRSDGGDLSPGALSALATLVTSGPLRQGDLAAREGVRAPTLTRIVAVLDERGLVERRPDPDDGRAVLVAASPDGVEVVRGARGARADELSRRMAALPAEQRAALAAALPALEALTE